MTLRSMPCFSRSPRIVVQEGSTFLDVNPLSGSKPMCATCLKCDGPDIRDLSIFVGFPDLFLVGEEDIDEIVLCLAESRMRFENRKTECNPPFSLRANTFLRKLLASLSLEKTMPIMHCCTRLSVRLPMYLTDRHAYITGK